MVFQVYTFAAPTAGDQQFASAFDAAFPNTADRVDSSWRVYNAFDVVPNAWQTLALVDSYYPSPPGPKATLAVTMLLGGIRLYAQGHAYVQPNAAGTTGAVRINANYTENDPAHTAPELAAFLGQLGFQHGCDTYLTLLDAPSVQFQL